MTSTLLDLLTPWLAHQRWYPLKGDSGRGACLRIVECIELPSDSAEVAYLVLILAVEPAVTSKASTEEYDDGATVTLQVPLGVYQDRQANLPELSLIGAVAAEAFAESSPQARHSLLGFAEATLSSVWVYDALADPGFLNAWLRVISGAVPLDGVSAWHSEELSALKSSVPVRAVRVMSAEQSNSSVVFDVAGRSLIAKFFRVLHPGVHPEVEIGRALAQEGNSFVPSLQAAVTLNVGSRAEPAITGENSKDERITLLVMHSFVGNGVDGWESALAAASSGADFSAQAESIGVALARVHGSLRKSMGAITYTDTEVSEFVEAIIARLTWAWDLAGAVVGDYGPDLKEVIAQLRYLNTLPDVQRIHADLHLGQLIHAAGPGEDRWYILDFEGEPLRSLAERGNLDVPLRDVVGMVRSFAYAAAKAQRRGDMSVSAAASWSKAACEGLIRGYQSSKPNSIDVDSVLFMALWLDKALYEVVYELANRPDWVEVPVNAVRNLFESRERSVDMGRKKTEPLKVDTEVLVSVSAGTYHAPHSVLGAHLSSLADGAELVTIRTLRHLAEAVSLVTSGGNFPMVHEHGGIWVAVLPVEEAGHVPDYRLDVYYADGIHRVDDAYRYLPTVGELDLHLMAEGRHETLWTVLGAHVHRYHSSLGEVSGVGFAVWVPGAQAVRVVGEFNDWDGRAHAMRSLGTSGVWELFIPGVAAGERYKFEILSEHGQWLQKADPMAYGTEVPPLTASRVVESTYSFKDSEWMAERAKRDPHNSPMSTYEVHLGSWRQGLSYRELAKDLVEYVKWLGFTHVEFMPVSEHPFGGSWGYQVTSYFAPTSRFGHPDEFRFLIDALHQAGIGVIMDWVPAHFPKDEWALAKFNGGPQYEHADPNLGEHPDWGTLIFDFGRNEVRNFLVANALYWMEEFHIDGLRVDAVASMLYLDYSREEGQWSPNKYGGRENLEAVSFLQEMNATAYRRNPGIVTIAEESTAFPGVTAPTSAGGLGFGIKWNMGWMHDSLSYMAQDPVNRGWHHNQITFSLVYAFTENFLLPISHDEVVHGKGSLLRKMPGDRWQQLANLRAYLAFQWAHPGKQLIFMGTEFAQEAEWSEQHGLDWWLADNPPHRGVQLLVKELNQAYSGIPALYEQDNTAAGFSWINGGDTENNVISFIRWDAAGNPLVCIINFAGRPYLGHRVGLPHAGLWEEVLNTDHAEYGGSDVRNDGVLTAEALAWDGQNSSIALRIPPLGALYLKPKKV